MKVYADRITAVVFAAAGCILIILVYFGWYAEPKYHETAQNVLLTLFLLILLICDALTNRKPKTINQKQFNPYK